MAEPMKINGGWVRAPQDEIKAKQLYYLYQTLDDSIVFQEES
jgi:hypothetical protein